MSPAHRGDPMAFEGAGFDARKPGQRGGRTNRRVIGACDETSAGAPDCGGWSGITLPNLSSSWLAPVPIRDYTTLLQPAVMSIDVLRPGATKRYLFQTFYHPYVCSFISLLNRVWR